jgi:hypothetical protein
MNRKRKEVKMVEQICPTCGCKISDNGYEKEGVMYCYEPCANGNQCECSCCAVVEEESRE